MPFAGSPASFARTSRTFVRAASSPESFRTIAAEPPELHGTAVHSAIRPRSMVSRPALRKA